MSSVKSALTRSRGLATVAYNKGLSLKASGFDISNIMGGSGLASLQGDRDRAANKQRYELNRGWVHAAVNALAMEAAERPVEFGKYKKLKTTPDKPKPQKTIMGRKMSDDEYEVIEQHPIIQALDKPNDIQYRWQFVYSFVCNLNLTGWAYVIADFDDKNHKYEFYSLPTTWVEPVHDPAPFSKFKIRNPNNPTSEAEELDRENVCFAYIPNPTNPFTAMSPAASQQRAIKIDDFIQSSQSAFFQNGIFPSVVITMGRDPHPNAPSGGLRPRLTPAQRRAVYSAIRKVSGGVANYGNPAIVDGLIEKIDRLSATQNEMGWEKSEKAIRTRILSAFSVHPYILGEEMAGSYAQAYNVEKRFYKRINTFLSMLSILMTDFVQRWMDESYFVEWKSAVAENPDIIQKQWDAARKNDDVSQNEYRAFMGLPPDEDGNESVLGQVNVQAVTTIAEKVSSGALTPEQGKMILISMGLPDENAVGIAGTGPSKEQIAQQEAQAQAALQQMQNPQQPPGKPGEKPPGKPPKPPVDEEEVDKKIEKFLSLV